jgi:hypothetical protein
VQGKGGREGCGSVVQCRGVKTVGNVMFIVCLGIDDWEDIASYGNVSVGERWVS